MPQLKIMTLPFVSAKEVTTDTAVKNTLQPA